MEKKIILTGDRPTGRLHIGHYAGSLRSRVKMQENYNMHVMVADAQALTDNAQNPGKVRENIFEVMYDYLAVGIDPTKSTILIQSQIPELYELTAYYMNLVSLSRVLRNPTVKTEIAQKGFEKSVPSGFAMYPISQAADITAFKAEVVPVGEDQLPMIELTNEIVRKFNFVYGEVLKEAEAVTGKGSRVPGIDGNAKMGKSLGNAIYLADTEEELYKKVMKMYTDPNHIRVEDPGKIEDNTVFEYLDIFGTDEEVIKNMKEHYQRGGLGDVKVKKYLFEVLNETLKPIRERRKMFESDPQEVMNILKNGTYKARQKAAQTLSEVKKAMHIEYL